MAVLGDGLVSISADMLRYHAVGGLPRLSLSAPEVRRQSVPGSGYKQCCADHVSRHSDRCLLMRMPL